MKLPVFLIEAFAEKPFTGNVAAVCPLEDWLDDKTLLAIAAENNQSETAFFLETDDEGVYELRWFTPESEVDLCGHATLATAFAIMTEFEPHLTAVRFKTRQAGDLLVTRTGKQFTLDFPARAYEKVECPADILAALHTNAAPVDCFKTARDLYVVFANEDAVRASNPDHTAICSSAYPWTCITAPSADKKFDFVSRFYTSDSSVTEDPVTGSTHCALVPYWADKLGKTELAARQLSVRGGNLSLALKKDRVLIGGQARIYMRGLIDI